MDRSCNPANPGTIAELRTVFAAASVKIEKFHGLELLQVLLDTVEVVICLSDKQISGVSKKQGLLQSSLLSVSPHQNQVLKISGCRKCWQEFIWRMDGILHVLVHASPLQCHCYCQQCYHQIYCPQHSHHDDLWSNQMLHFQ